MKSKFEIGQLVVLKTPGKESPGEVIARTEHATKETDYLLRYTNGDGITAEGSWPESELNAAPAGSKAA